MESLRDRLLRIEEDLLSSLARGSHAVEAFDISLTYLMQDVEHAIAIGALDDDTQSLAYSCASRVAVIAEAFYQVDLDARALSDSMIGDLETILSELTLDDVSTTATSSPVARTTLHKEIHNARAAVQSWLLNNLHNPYPSQAVKQKLATKSGVDLKVISGLLKDTRECIGWTRLRRKSFRGSRANMVKAASQLFLGAKSATLVSSELVVEFMSVKHNIEDLICNVVPFHDDLDERKKSSPADATLPPTLPHVAPTVVSTSPSYDQPESRDLSRKKRSFDSLCPEMDSVENQSPKRVRDGGSCGRSSCRGDRTEPTQLVNITADVLPITSSRKRRLSDTDVYPDAKRPRGVSFQPRAQTVSDPLPSQSLHGLQPLSWLDSVDSGLLTTDLNTSASLDIDVFDGWDSLVTFTSPDQTVADTFINAPSLQDFDLPAGDLFSLASREPIPRATTFVGNGDATESTTEAVQTVPFKKEKLIDSGTHDVSIDATDSSSMWLSFGPSAVIPGNDGTQFDSPPALEIYSNTPPPSFDSILPLSFGWGPWNYTTQYCLDLASGSPPPPYDPRPDIYSHSEDSIANVESWEHKTHPSSFSLPLYSTV